MDEFYNKHYITVDERDRVTDGWLDGPHRDDKNTEIEADRAMIPPPPPSELEKLRADVDFIAVMQGVELI